MKPWLFDILACPIDKHFPLKLYIFSFETKPEEFELFLTKYKNRNIEFIKKEKIIEIFFKNENIYVKDNIVFEKTPIKMYLELTISSIHELDNIFDKSPNEISKKCFELISTEIKNKIFVFSKNQNITNIDDIIPELYFLNKIKIETEIESGMLFCEKCYRWFPIIETIPQMLPDEYRDEKKDVLFLKNNKDLLDKEFFKLNNLKPFNI
ncbi:MAG: Trm112 family protein [Promethearchaeota archaeon]